MTTDPGGGPSRPPAPPEFGVAAAVGALGRLPLDLVVTLGYVVREVPLLVQDLRSTVHDVARLAHGGETGALGQLVTALADAASPGGALHRLLDAGADLAAAEAAETRRDL